MATLDKFKVSLLSWDSTKNKDSFYGWVDEMISTVRTLEHGESLMDWLDIKLRRNLAPKASIPAFLLDDPDFQSLISKQYDAQAEASAHTEEDIEDESGSIASPIRSVGSAGTAGTAMGITPQAKEYLSLPKETIELDKQLFQVLRGTFVLRFRRGCRCGCCHKDRLR